MKADAHLQTHETISAEQLRHLRLFADADVEVVAGMLEHCSIRQLRKDAMLLKPGDANRTLYLVLGGRLRVHVGTLSADAVQWMQAGEAVGEISLIDEKPASAYVVADAPTSVLEIDQATFWTLVNASHAIARNMLLMVVDRMRANNALIADGMRLREQFRHTNVDDLTGLRNYKAIEDLLRRQLLRSSMNRKPLAVLMIDIDHFTDFNNDFGHEAGDHAICGVAQTLQDQVRPTDIVGRVEDEKFVVLLPECDANGAAIVAARLRETVAETVVAMQDGSILPSVTVSIGIAEAQPFQRAEMLLQDADQALGRAKQSGRNTFCN